MREGYGIANQQMNAAVTMPIEKAPSIGDELSTNDKRIQELHGAITQLEQRLSSILRAVPPVAGGSEPGTPPMPWSAVVCALKNAGYQTEAATARIQDLLNRLEV